MNLYGVYDNKAKRYISVTMSETDDTFVRSGLFPLLMDYPLQDIEFYQIGLFDFELGIIKPCKPRKCDWECYKFPTTRLEKNKFLSLEEIEESARNKKHEFLQKQKDKIEDAERELASAKALLQVEEGKDKKEKDKKRIREIRDYIKQLSDEINHLKELN